MKNPKPTPYTHILAVKFLKRLLIHSSEAEQLNLLELLLNIIGNLPEELTSDERLSEQELECLYWLTHGCSQYQTATLMNIKRETVKEYQNRIQHKYDSRTISHTIYKSIQYHSLKKDYRAIKESLHETANKIQLLVEEIK